MKLIKGDKIIVIKGKDRSKSDKIIKAMPKESMVVVESLNMRKKTIRPKKQGEKGQVVDVPWPMRADNVMLICPSCNKPTRIGHRIDSDKKVRYCKKCKAAI